jgi:5-methylcytosine-specific restriction endonuclease McrA
MTANTMSSGTGEVVRSCQHCGTSFTYVPKRGPVPKWCSPACANRAYRRRRNPSNFGPQPCAFCGTTFERSPTAKRQRVCSAECRRKLYCRDNKATVDAQQNAWHRKHKDRQRGYVKASHAKRPEYYRLLRRVYEAARRARFRGSFTAAEWESLKVFYGGFCLCCAVHDSEMPLHADHVEPVSKNGMNCIWNIQPLCQPCNSSKFTASTDYRLDALVGLA